MLEHVQTRAKYLIFDVLGFDLVGARLPWVKKAVNAGFATEPEGVGIPKGTCSLYSCIYDIVDIDSYPMSGED